MSGFGKGRNPYGPRLKAGGARLEMSHKDDPYMSRLDQWPWLGQQKQKYPSLVPSYPDPNCKSSLVDFCAYTLYVYSVRV